MTISKEIIEVLEYLCMKFGIVIDWTSDTVIPYIQTLCEKYIAWEIATSKMWIVLGGIMMLIGVVIFCCDAFIWKSGFDALLGVVIFGIGVALVGCQVYDIITCIHFPEMQLYEYITTHINQG